MMIGTTPTSPLAPAQSPDDSALPPGEEPLLGATRASFRDDRREHCEEEEQPT